jgi:hypothetical protein
LVFSSVECACGALAYRIDGREGRLPLLRMLAMRFGYRQLLYVVVVHAVASALHGIKVRWGAQQRSGNAMNNEAPPLPQTVSQFSSITAGLSTDPGEKAEPPLPAAA